MGRIVLVLAMPLATLLGACVAKPIKEVESGNAEVKVSLLFMVEGCRVYRFEDERWHYVTICGQQRAGTTTTWSEQCGKNCRRTVSDLIETKQKGEP